MIALLLRQSVRFCLYLCLLLWAFQVFAREENSAVVEQSKKAVVLITTADAKGKPLMQGSGFFVAANRIVTNFHVVKNSNNIQVKTYKGQTFKVARIISFNDKRDLALLELQQQPTNINTLTIADSMPEAGSRIFVVSNPKGSFWKVTKGNTESVWDFQGIGELLQISAEIYPGSSGGPVIDYQGRVIGIAVMHTNGAFDLNFAIPASAIEELQMN